MCNSRTAKPVLFLVLLSISLLTAAISYARPPAHGRRHTRSVGAEEAMAAAKKKEALRRKLSGLHSHMHTVRARIHKARVKEQGITETIGTVQGRLVMTKARLDSVNSRLRTLNQQHYQTVTKLDETEQRLADRRRLLAERVVENYRRSQTSYADVLIQSRSVHELLSRGYYIRQIVHSDADLILGVKQDIAEIESDKRLIESQEHRQAALASEFEEQKTLYATDLVKEHVLLAGVRQDRAAAEDELDGLEDEANAMTSNIRELSEILERRREAERAAREAVRSQKGGRHQTGSGGDSGDGDEPGSIAPIWHGNFIRPVPGPVTSGFGYRYHPILHRRRMHTGIDFGAPYGAPIHAAGDGTVILAQYNNGYGNCVVIDHGAGVTTLYGHCSSLGVSVGQIVRQGQVIARVGATGMATGPHLHFEVRRNGVPVAPFQ